jgi:hypothetical protein
VSEGGRERMNEVFSACMTEIKRESAREIGREGRGVLVKERVTDSVMSDFVGVSVCC